MRGDDLHLATIFTVAPSPAQVVFGPGALARLPSLVESMGAHRVLLLASRGRPSLVQEASALLGERLAGVDHRAVMHVPAELAEAALHDAQAKRADLVVALGGGSAIGMAKAIALHDGPPCIAIPTTYSGSEMTPIWGMTRSGVKETGRDERVRPRAVLYDPLLTLDLPPRISGASALNAMAHCIEALYAPDANPVSTMFAADGIRAIVRSMRRVLASPHDVAARTEALYGAWLAGASLGSTTMGLHHKLCHTLGGSFGLPHAETHAVMLPYTVAYNAASAPGAMRTVAESLDGSLRDPVRDVPRWLHALLHQVASEAGMPVSLQALGLDESALPQVAALATARPYPNPRAVEEEGVLALVQRAFRGHAP